MCEHWTTPTLPTEAQRISMSPRHLIWILTTTPSQDDPIIVIADPGTVVATPILGVFPPPPPTPPPSGDLFPRVVVVNLLSPPLWPYQCHRIPLYSPKLRAKFGCSAKRCHEAMDRHDYPLLPQAHSRSGRQISSSKASLDVNTSLAKMVKTTGRLDQQSPLPWHLD